MPSWIVRVRCEVTKDLICEDCTEQEARMNPFQFSKDETEIDMHNWEVLKLEADQ